MNASAPPLFLATCVVILGLLPSGCDKVTALLGGEKGAEGSKAEHAATDAKTEVAPAEPGKAAPPADADAAKDEAPAPEPGPGDETPPSNPSDTPDSAGRAGEGDAAADAAADATPTADATPSADADADAATAGKQPCIVGRWKAVEYLAEVRRAIAKDPTLSKLKKSSSGGLLGYDVGPADAGKGSVAAKAESLRYVFKGKVEGFPVTLTFTLDGEAEADYSLVGNDTIIVAKPKKDTFVARANAKVEGFAKFSKSPRVDHEFDGTFNYTCSDNKLEVWRLGNRKDAVTFEREAP